MTVTSLTFGGVTITDSCRTAAYDSVAAYTAAVAADAYVPSPSLIGRSDCACTDCPTPAPSLYPTQPGKLAPWVSADRPDSAELWDIRSSVWERQTAITDGDAPCGPTSWRWEVELVGSPAGRRHGLTWLAQRLHAAAGCRAGSCTDCGAHTLAVSEDCGPVRTVRDARAVVVRELFEDVGACTSRVEVLFEAADGRMWDAPEVVTSYPAAAWSEAECNPLHPLLIDCDCAPDPCTPTAVRWDSMQPGCIVVPGDGDDSVLTRVVQSPDASAFYDLTRAGLRAPFRSVTVYDTTGGKLRAAPSGVVWSLAGTPGGPSNTATVDVTDADGVSCRFRLGLLAVFCRDPIVERPSFDSTSTLVRAAQSRPVTQPLPGFDASGMAPFPDPITEPRVGVSTVGARFAPLPEIEVTPFVPGDPFADPPVPDIPATYRSAMTTGGVSAVHYGNPSVARGQFGPGWSILATNTGRENDLTGATIHIWPPDSGTDDTSYTLSSSGAYGVASHGTPVWTSGRHWVIEDVEIGAADDTGYGDITFAITGTKQDGSDSNVGGITVEMFPASAASSLSNAPTASAPGPPVIPPSNAPTGAVSVELMPAAAIVAPGATYAGTVWQATVANLTPRVGGYGSIPGPAGAGIEIQAVAVRVWKPAQVVSWTITPTALGPYSSLVPGSHTVTALYDQWTVSKIDASDAIVFNVTAVTRNNADDDIGTLNVEMFTVVGNDQQLGAAVTGSAPGPVVPVVQPRPNVTAYINASLNRNISSIGRGETITDDVWTVFVAANGQDSITGGTLRIAMPTGVSSWAWSVNTVGLVTYTNNSPAWGNPYIELTNITLGNSAASYLTVTISRVTHNDSLADVGTLDAELFGGVYGNLDTTAGDTAPGPTLGPCPPSRWYEDNEFQHATIVSGPDGIAWWSWDGAVGQVTSSATNGTLYQQGGGFRWQSFSTDKTGAVTLSDESGRHAVVAIQPGPHLADTLDCDTVIAPPTATGDECETWCEPFMRRTLFVTVAAESTDYAALLRFNNGPAVHVGVHVWTNPTTCPPTSEACPPADRVIPVALPYISTTTLGTDTLRVARITGTVCDDPIRGLPEVTTDCGGLCIGLTIEGDATPPTLVELLAQSWVE